MAEKTYDVEDPRDLPYRFAFSSITDEIFVITFWRGLGVSMVFENRPAFHRFLLEGMKTDHKITEEKIEGGLKEALDILKAKEGDKK